MIKNIFSFIGVSCIVLAILYGLYMVWGMEVMSQGVSGKHFWEKG